MNGTIECAFVGVLGKTPELRETRAGVPLLSFGVAVSEGERTQWVQVTAFDELATALQPMLTKGVKVYVEGRIRMTVWDEDGIERHGLSVVASHVEALGLIGKRRPVTRHRSRSAPLKSTAEPNDARRHFARPAATAARVVTTRAVQSSSPNTPAFVSDWSAE
jgi:single-strand DNA-binding protein